MFYTLTGSFLKGPIHLIHIIISMPSYLHFSGLKVNIWRQDDFGVVLTGSVRQLIMIPILCFKIEKKSKISSHQKGQKGWAVPGVPSPSEFITHSSPFCAPSTLPFSLNCRVEVWRLVRERQLERWWRRAKEKGLPHMECSLSTKLLVFNVSFHLHRHCEVSFMVFLTL